MQLFDLAEDRGERDDLAERHARRRRVGSASGWTAHLAAIGAQLPIARSATSIRPRAAQPSAAAAAGKRGDRRRRNAAKGPAMKRVARDGAPSSRPCWPPFPAGPIPGTGIARPTAARAAGAIRLPAGRHPLPARRGQGRAGAAAPRHRRRRSPPSRNAAAIATRRDDRWFYVESNGIPDHPLMVGIRAGSSRCRCRRTTAATTPGRSRCIPCRPRSAGDDEGPVSARCDRAGRQRHPDLQSAQQPRRRRAGDRRTRRLRRPLRPGRRLPLPHGAGAPGEGGRQGHADRLRPRRLPDLRLHRARRLAGEGPRLDGGPRGRRRQLPLPCHEDVSVSQRRVPRRGDRARRAGRPAAAGRAACGRRCRRSAARRSWASTRRHRTARRLTYEVGGRKGTVDYTVRD